MQSFWCWRNFVGKLWFTFSMTENGVVNFLIIFVLEKPIQGPWMKQNYFIAFPYKNLFLCFDKMLNLVLVSLMIMVKVIQSCHSTFLQRNEMFRFRVTIALSSHWWLFPLCKNLLVFNQTEGFSTILFQMIAFAFSLLKQLIIYLHVP